MSTARPHRGRAAAAALATLATLALAACGGSSTSSGTSPQLPHRTAPLLSIFEDEGLLHAAPAAALRTFQLLGANTVRVFLPWDAIAPDSSSLVAPAFDAGDPAAYPQSAWAIYDEIVRDAAARGIRVDLLVGAGAPLWATGPGIPVREYPKGHVPAHPGLSPHAGAWEPSASAFGAFVHALGVRYSGHYRPAGAAKPLPRVDFWSIWNEPNVAVYLAPQTTDGSAIEVAPRLYRALLDAAWRALAQTGHTPATDTILIGETAPDGVSDPDSFVGGLVPLRFLDALYCVDSSFAPLRGTAATLRGCPASAAGSASFVAGNPALFDASGYAAHPYESDKAPTDTTGDQPGDADFSELGNLERTLDRAAAAYGSHARLPIYITEFGYNSSLLASPAGEVDYAAYMNEAEYLSWLDPRIRSYDQYLLKDAPVGGFDTGLVAADGAAKPTAPAYVIPLWLPVTSAPRGARLDVWGCARPAPYAQRITHRPQRVQIQFLANGQGVFHTIRTVTLAASSGCYFDVRVKPPASGQIRLLWVDAAGDPHASRSQAISLR